MKPGAEASSSKLCLAQPDKASIRLDVEELAFSRNDRTIFADLSFSLEGGCILQVEGPNGSGKTTLLRTLCGLLPYASGEIRWCGEPIGDIYPDFLAQLAYVGHSAGISADMTPLENLRTARAMTRTPALTPEQALDRLAFPRELEDVPCRQLSAGQRRRVALGRLLLCGARLWLLDEPFTALDTEGRALIEALLAEHAAGDGMAVVSTHHPLRPAGCAIRSLHLC